MTYDEMRIRQAWPYEVKVKHAEKVAREFIEKVSAGIEYGGDRGDKYQAQNVHISVGGLDSITLLLFLRDRFPNENITAISRSSLEDKSIQDIHKQLGVISIPGLKTKTSIIQEYGFPVISKAKAARICGVSRTTVQRWEDPGSSSLPDIGHMAALARQYGWTLMEYAREWLGLEGGSEDQKARR